MIIEFLILPFLYLWANLLLLRWYLFGRRCVTFNIKFFDILLRFSSIVTYLLLHSIHYIRINLSFIYCLFYVLIMCFSTFMYFPPSLFDQIKFRTKRYLSLFSSRRNLTTSLYCRDNNGPRMPFNLLSREMKANKITNVQQLYSKDGNKNELPIYTETKNLTTCINVFYFPSLEDFLRNK